MRERKWEDYGEEDLKLIKIKILFLVLLLFTSVGLASDLTDSIKLNNEAVEMLDEALKLRRQTAEERIDSQTNELNKKLEDLQNVKEKLEQVNQSETIFGKLWALVFGGTSSSKANDKSKKDKDAKKESEESSDLKPGEFIAEQSKEEKESGANKVDDSLVYEAHKKILKATLKSSGKAEVRMNLGLTFELSGELENAFKAYNMAELATKQNPSLEFIAKYNKARILAAQKKIPEAIAQYQSALDMNPESLEIKTNIELLMQQQQGGGKGGKDKKDKEGDGEGEEPKPDSPVKENPKNSDYKSQNLSKKDVEKILEELKNQEQNIREKEYNKGVKEKSRDKDW